MLPQDHPANSPEGDSTLAPGVAIGRYVVLTLVGRGGMGEVYSAYDPDLDRKVAIKLLRGRSENQAGQDGSGRARLLREAQAIAKLSHPNVVVVFDVGTFHGQVFIAMEFVDGQTVRYWMHMQTRALPDILEIFIAAGRGLGAAHEKQLVHRDFKPDNVMVSANGQVRVMDFGMVRLVSNSRPDAEPTAVPDLDSVRVQPVPLEDLESTRILSMNPAGATTAAAPMAALESQLTKTGSILGTPAYMAPEQFLGGTTDPRTDQFSYCVALHEAVYGKRPFAGTSLIDLKASVMQGQVRPAPDQTKVPLWLRRVLLRGLSPDPDQRWPSMNALLAVLERNRAVAGRRRFTAGAATKLAGIWEAPSRGHREETAAKASIRQAFAATGKRYAADAFENVSRILDRYATAWSEMYTNAGEAHARGEQSSEVLDLRMAALQEALAALRALSQAFRGATASMVENAIDAANSLPRIERCADIELLRAVVTPPEDPRIGVAVERIRGQLAEVRIASRVGRVAEALKAIDPIEKEVRQIGYGPLVAEVLLEVASLHPTEETPGRRVSPSRKRSGTRSSPAMTKWRRKRPRSLSVWRRCRAASTRATSGPGTRTPS
jgi:serine/threonine protein kinase